MLKSEFDTAGATTLSLAKENMKALILITILAAATIQTHAHEDIKPIEGSPKVTQIHRNGGTVVRNGIEMSGDRHGCELSVPTDHGTYIFDWFIGDGIKFAEGTSYRFILADDRKSLSEIRSLDGKVVWKAGSILSQAEAKLLRIYFAEPTLIRG